MSLQIGDKVTHPLTGDTVLTVLTVGPENIMTTAGGLIINGPASEFTPYTPARPSTKELANRVYRAYNSLLDAHEASAMCAQALAEAATSYAERLEEETK